MLLAGCACVCLTMEAVARVALDPSSRIQSRLIQEYGAARSIGAGAAPGQRHLLFVGNSLLDEGVEFGRLRAAFPDDDARRFMVEQTFYYDWYYGLKRLFSEGARPDVVVVMLAVGHWVADNIRGDFSAHYLFNTADLPALSRDLDLHPTTATSLYLANLSKFWGSRAEMRNFVIGHTMPDFGRLMNFTMVVNRRPIVNEDVETILNGRIERLRELVAEHGSRLVLLVPPLLNPEDGSIGLMRAASTAGVPVLRPVASGTFNKQLYRDAGFHLNAEGASTFTERLIPALRTELSGLSDRPVDATEARYLDSELNKARHVRSAR